MQWGTRHPQSVQGLVTDEGAPASRRLRAVTTAGWQGDEASSARRLVLVTGSGRSGTSSLAGSLQRLGWHVPLPLLDATEINPRGFYESQRVVELHERLLGSVPVRTNDARPEAAAAAAEAAADPAVLDELVAWLREQDGADQLLIKDPRIFWVPQLWRDAAAATGRDLVFLVTLRHPTVVARSRDTAFLSGESDEVRLRRSSANVAGWVNNTLESVAATQGVRRSWVRYDDLLADWRSCLARVDAQTGLGLPATVRDGSPHDVDDFLTPELNRSRVSWSDVEVLDELRVLAERLWNAVTGLVEEPEDVDRLAEVAACRAAYARLHSLAAGLAFHETEATVTTARRRVQRRLNRRHRAEMQDLRTQLG